MYGVSYFVAPIVAPGKRFNYFDPLRTLAPGVQQAWQTHSRDEIVASVQSTAREDSHPRRRRTDAPVQLPAA